MPGVTWPGDPPPIPRRLPPLPAAPAALGAAAPAAHATTVSALHPVEGTTIVIDDTQQLADDLVVSGSQATGTFVHSNAAKILAGPSCQQTSVVDVTCEAGKVTAILGGGNDKVTLTTTDLVTEINGQAGDDTFDVNASTGPDTIIGSEGVFDRVLYDKRSAPVLVTQDGNANDGVGGLAGRPLFAGSDEHDNISADTEIVEGG